MNPEPASMNPEDYTAILQRLAKCEERLDLIQGLGFVCVGCKFKQPAHFYWYAAFNSETKQLISPLCAMCVRGETSTDFKIWGPPWKHQGPFSQPVKWLEIKK